MPMHSLLAPLVHLKGVGEAVLKKLAGILYALGGENAPLALRDLLFHLPVNLVDRRTVTAVSEAEVGIEQVFQVRVIEHVAALPSRMAQRRKLPYRVVVADESDQMILTFFHVNTSYLMRILPVNAERIVAGKPSRYDGVITISHPSTIVALDKKNEVLRIHPVYPASVQMGSKAIARLMREALASAAPPAEWIAPSLLQSQKWPGMIDALKALHQPQSMEALAFQAPHRARLAYDEVLAHQCMLQRLRRLTLQENVHVIMPDAQTLQRFMAVLSFTLTAAQVRAFNEILGDMASNKPMTRMIQGDVGCGKTIVAFLAMAVCVHAGKQALLMAPTDLLARQHMESLAPLAAALGFTMTLLTGKLASKERKIANEKIASGEAQMIVGTHALFQSEVSFHDLALTIIDEQHRFGVNQRKKLSEKGLRPHLLQMSATPIPRSLTMTLYGDLDISIIDELPPGRLLIDTRTMPQAKADEVMQGLARMFEKGERAYWVCPLVAPNLEEEESTEIAFAAAETRYLILREIFPNKVGLVHGQMPVKQREETMQAFVRGELSLLVATTVIEVGVNVPEATVMVIEQAERFGLAQLHQLRGRVGRGKAASHCILLYGERLSEIARQRLKIIRSEHNGFVLAEEDLRLRGSGDVLGTKQTGLPEFVFADIGMDQQLFRLAREQAQGLLQQDPILMSAEGKAMRRLIEIFGYDVDFISNHAA